MIWKFSITSTVCERFSFLTHAREHVYHVLLCSKNCLHLRLTRLASNQSQNWTIARYLFCPFSNWAKIGNQKNNLFVFFILLVEPDIEEKKKKFFCFGFFLKNDKKKQKRFCHLRLFSLCCIIVRRSVDAAEMQLVTVPACRCLLGKIKSSKKWLAFLTAHIFMHQRASLTRTISLTHTHRFGNGIEPWLVLTDWLFCIRWRRDSLRPAGHGNQVDQRFPRSPLAAWRRRCVWRALRWL